MPEGFLTDLLVEGIIGGVGERSGEVVAETLRLDLKGNPRAKMQGIRDGFLAPYKVVKVHLDVDVEGYRPAQGEVDKYGYEIEDRIYNQKDYDRHLVIDERTLRVARKVTEFLKESGNRFQKTIVFCVDTEHAARMRKALVNENADLVQQNERYVMLITGDDAEGCAQVGEQVAGAISCLCAAASPSSGYISFSIASNCATSTGRALPLARL